jgi:hypothetical protein
MKQVKEFNPFLTPLQMLQLGVFEGCYFKEDIKEYPIEWQDCVNSDDCGPHKNLFKVTSGQSLEIWHEAGWIRDQDPRGWFQWYCRYHLGRRSEDDQRQINRHHSFARHAAQVLKNGNGDLTKRRVQRQALLQWAYNPNPDVKDTSFENLIKIK